MTIKETLDGLFKAALKANDTQTKNVIRQIRAKVHEHLLAKGLPRDLADDGEWIEVMSAYSRSLAKAVELMERRGAAETDLLRQYRVEIDFCAKYLPKPKTLDEVKELVSAKAEELEAQGVSDVGSLVKAVLADAEKGSLDPRMVHSVAKSVLG